MARSAFSVLALLVWLPGCNAILGMDRAHLDEGDASTPKKMGTGGRPTTQGGAGGTQSDTLADCNTTSDECMQCLDANCPGVAAACLADPHCRINVEQHSLCLANSPLCEDNGCSNQIEMTTVGKTDLGLCMAQCVDHCSSRGLMPMCDLYCACMETKCPDQFSDLGKTRADCIDNCNTDPSIKSNALCRVRHCEVAGSPKADHCLHAVGDPNYGMCTAPIKRCLGLVPTGLPYCTSPEDCCSKKCGSNNVCLP